jgi:plasmid stability protein
MTITLNLPPATVEKLHAQAAAHGKDVETFVREAVEAKLVVSGLSFREILGPLHREVQASGISEKELEALADEAVAEARTARNAPRKQK